MPSRARGQIRTLLQLDGWTCVYCNIELTEETATREHVIPQSQGGPTALWNLALACARCNGARHSKALRKKLGLTRDFFKLSAGHRLARQQTPLPYRTDSAWQLPD